MTKMLKNEKGFTLIEIVVVMIISAIIIVPLFSTFINGVSTQKKASKQDKYQTLARKAMYEIVDGSEKNKGIRAAKAATNLNDDPSNIVFLASGKNIIYFEDDGILYTYTSDETISSIPETGVATPVIDNVEYFNAETDGEKTVTLNLWIKDSEAKVKLDTKVVMRNKPKS
jgi:prepilin-type N-terminal cleavage/methylation domain-containing protein